ncbi:MAG TPA: Hsp20/alpha crystallin family protein [Candidatus Paceibacterota bacterium]
MSNKKRGFFERLTGGIKMEEEYEVEPAKTLRVKEDRPSKGSDPSWLEDENDEAELAVDVFQTASEIIVQTFVAGVKTEDLELSIARDMITIKGKREESRSIDEDDYFVKELYWGKFTRTILLPQEVEPDEAEAIEKHGLLSIKLQKVDKGRKNVIKVKSV